MKRRVMHFRLRESRYALCGWEPKGDLDQPAGRICGPCLNKLYLMACRGQRLLSAYDGLTLALNVAADLGKKIGPEKARRLVDEAEALLNAGAQ